MADTNFELVRRYLDAANIYLDGVTTLARHSPRPPVDTCGLLAAHAVEVGLKAFLLWSGQPEAQVRKIGHDLRRAWDETRSAGLGLPEHHPWWVHVLATGHGAPYLYRYPKVGIASAIPTVDELQYELRELVGLLNTTIKLP